MHPLAELKYRYLKWKISRVRRKFDVCVRRARQRLGPTGPLSRPSLSHDPAAPVPGPADRGGTRVSVVLVQLVRSTSRPLHTPAYLTLSGSRTAPTARPSVPPRTGRPYPFVRYA